MRNTLRRIAKNLILLLFFMNIIIPDALSQQASKYKTAVIYYNEACTMCTMYIKHRSLR